MDHPAKLPSELLLEVVNELRKEARDKWEEKESVFSTPPSLKIANSLVDVPSCELMPILVAYLDVQHERYKELLSALGDHMPNERDAFWRILLNIPASAIKAKL